MKTTETNSCPDCEGTGLDKEHTWPDGSFAHCARCNGYGETQSPNMNMLPELLQESLAAACREYAIRDLLDCIAVNLHEMAEEAGDEESLHVMNDDAQIIAHAANHVTN